MRLSKPRIQPMREADWDAEQREILERTREGGRILNIFSTVGRHAKLLKRWLPFANHILFKSALGARERELLILRIGWLCRAEYEWGQHVLIGRRAGLSEEEIRRIAEGPDAAGWDAFDAALLRAADELHRDACIGDDTWQALSARYDERQMMDVVFTVGNYNLVSMALNSFGVRLDEGVPGFAATAGRDPEPVGR